MLEARLKCLLADQASLWDARSFLDGNPALKTPGYCQMSLQDMNVRCRIEMIEKDRGK